MKDIPHEIRQFIAKHINSVEQLEALLLLHSDTSKQWSAETLANELRINPQWAAMRLKNLCAQGFLTVQESGRPLYQFNTGAPDLIHLIHLLKNIYTERRVTVINLIYSKPLDNIHIFAEAFRFKKDDYNG